MHLGGRAGTTTKGQSLWLAASGEGEWEVTAERVKNLLLQKFLAKNKVYFKKKKKKKGRGILDISHPKLKQRQTDKTAGSGSVFILSAHLQGSSGLAPLPPKAFHVIVHLHRS